MIIDKYLSSDPKNTKARLAGSVVELDITKEKAKKDLEKQQLKHSGDLLLLTTLFICFIWFVNFY